MMRDVSSYFKSVSKEMRPILMAVDELKEKEAREAVAAEKVIVEKEKRARILAGYAKANAERKRKRIEQAENQAVVTDPNIAAIEEISLEDSDEPAGVQKRAFNARPLNWKVMAEFYVQWGKKKTKAAFSSDFKHRTERSMDQALDLRSKRDFTGHKKAPAYGNEIDQKLLCEVKVIMASGLPIDDSTSRMMLMTLLRNNDKCHLLMDNGGDYDFQHGWASRFWKRHNIASRVVTTKMRIIPSNFAVLEEQYITVAAQMIFYHKVPPDLVYGQDETNAQFVSTPNKARAEKGSNRIRLLGVGAEMTQIPVTFSLKETGEVVGLRSNESSHSLVLSRVAF
jgi:hypothetical protein